MSQSSIILASGSPRRRELLAGMGVTFEVVTSDVPELEADSSPHLTPAELARGNAELKAKAVAALRPGRWILGADTVVNLNKRVFGKPSSLDQAREFLLALSGRTHEVITGCALLSPEGAAEIFHEISRVTFLVLSWKIVSRYLGEVHVLDKAGAYALQDHGEWIVRGVEGSRSNIIGLPTEALAATLKNHRLL
jgi:septum formation protein